MLTPGDIDQAAVDAYDREHEQRRARAWSAARAETLADRVKSIPDDRPVFLNVEVPHALRRDLKVLAQYRSTSVKALVNNALASYVRAWAVTSSGVAAVSRGSTEADDVAVGQAPSHPERNTRP